MARHVQRAFHSERVNRDIFNFQRQAYFKRTSSVVPMPRSADLHWLHQESPPEMIALPSLLKTLLAPF